MQAMALLLVACALLCGRAEASTSFTDDRGDIWSLTYGGAPLPDNDPLHETFRVTLGVDTNHYSLANTFIDQVALKVSNSLFAYSLFSAPDGAADWTLDAGGLNANGCSGSGAGFLCADSALVLNSGKGEAVSGGNGPGVDLAWTFDLTMPNGALFTGLDQATVKARYVGTSGSRHLVGANLTLAAAAVAVPEPETYALIASGLGFLGWIARRRTRSRRDI